ncbi:MAG: hypothetical protein HYV26_18430 [Candidatus Hydrogenedentes bacterium]|nr:hypothetical protein [Candidatus Hydrogenedentota bacterium]
MNTLVRKITGFAAFAAFLVALWLPGLDSMLGFDPYPEPYERRELAKWPGIPRSLDELYAFPVQFESYFNDHFGLRSAFIHMNSLLRVRGLNVSSAKNAMLGKEDWLYLANPEVVDSYRVPRPSDAAQLERWTRTAQQRANWCKKKGVRTLNVWLPEKQTLYPEFLPDWLEPAAPRTNLEVWTRQANKMKLPFLSLAPALRGAKETQLIFYRTDSHWNSYGAYAAYLAIMKRVTEIGVYPHVLGKKELVKKEIVKMGDIAQLLNLEEYYLESRRELRVRQPKAKPVPFQLRGQELPPHAQVQAFAQPDAQLPRIVIFSDSFGYEILPFLVESFSRTVHVRYPHFSPEIILQEKPDIVVELHAARHLEAAGDAGADEQ